MGRINEKLRMLDRAVQEVLSKVREMEDYETQRPPKPHSKVGGNKLIENGEFIYDPNAGYWKTRAYYYDDPDYGIAVRG